jgi:flagellar biosynthesis protein FlhB
MDEPRTESATPRKLARARQQGFVPKSPDLVAAAVLFALLATAVTLGARLWRALEGLLTTVMHAVAAPVPPGLDALAAPLREVTWLALAPLLAIAVAAALGNVVQIGPLFAGAAVAPDLRRLDPTAQLRALLSPQHWVGIGIGAVKSGILLAVAAWAVFEARDALTTLGAGSAERALFVLSAICGQVVLSVAVATALLGAADLVYRRVQHAHALRMSRREWTREQRDDGGLPEHRQHRRRMHAEMLAQRAMDEACVLLVDSRPRAVDSRPHAVDTRPRALALAFDAETDSAPRVAFKAQGDLALRARASAERAGLAVRSEPALLGALFSLELTEVVPRAQHAAVAEIMRELIASGALAPLPPRRAS